MTTTMQARSVAGVAPHGFALLTLTVAADNPRTGVRDFRVAWKGFSRRRVFLRAFSGGEAHLQPEPACGDNTGRSWNVHAHAIVELVCPLDCIAVTTLQAGWAKSLAALHLTGSLDLRQGSNLKPEFFIRE